MESHNYLGIYISKDTATAVCLGPQGKGGKVLDCFSVSIEDREQANMQTLASLLAQGCTERKLKFSEVAVALDCAMFMQHSVHSEFSDPKRIAATVKFDTEEALATDIADVALAFEIASSDETGSDLTVFTAQREVLTDVLVALQEYNFDPVAIEPDVYCLSRFICRNATSTEPEQGQTLFGILSRRSGYLVAPPGPTDESSQAVSTVRTFLLGATQDRGNQLSREVLVTTALVEGGEPIRCLKVFDSAGAIDYRQLGEKLGIEADEIDLFGVAGTEPQTAGDCTNAVDFALACGAALTHWQKGRSVNFRSDDFNPFQGKTLRLQRALRFAAVSVAILFIAAGLYFQKPLFDAKTYASNLRVKFAKDYSGVALDKLSDTVRMKDAVKKLSNIKRLIESKSKGLVTDETSVSSKLTLVLAAFNKCAAQTNLNIKSITISPKSITVSGDTSSRQTRQKLFDTVRGGGLEIVKEDYGSKGGREVFNIMLATNK